MYRWKTFTELTRDGKHTPYESEIWDTMESNLSGGLLASLKSLTGPRTLSYEAAGRMINQWGREEGWGFACQNAIRRFQQMGIRVILLGDEYRPLTREEIQSELEDDLYAASAREFYERLCLEQSQDPQEVLVAVLRQLRDQP